MNAMETRIFQDLRRSNLLKSWLIFYRFGLKDFLMRATLMSFFENVARCIPRFGDLEELKFDEVFCHPQRTIYLSKKQLLKCMNIISIGWNVLLMENLSRFLILSFRWSWAWHSSFLYNPIWFRCKCPTNLLVLCDLP